MIVECSACRLHKLARHFVWSDGDPDSGLAILGESPGLDEDAQGLPFVGRASKLLWKLLAEIEIDRTSCYIGNILKCMASDDGRRFRKPFDDEVAACTARWTFPELRAIRPRVIVAAGGVAASALLGREVRITAERGTVHRTEFCDRTVLTLHPSYLLRQDEDPELMAQVRGDLRLAQTLLAGDEIEGAGGLRAFRLPPAPDVPVAWNVRPRVVRAADNAWNGVTPVETNGETKRPFRETLSREDETATGGPAPALVERETRATSPAAALGTLAIGSVLPTRADEAAQWEQRIVQAPPWNPDRRYVAGWSDERDVVLLYRDAQDRRQIERVTGFPWYFLMRADDALRVPARLWERHRERGVFERLEIDPVSGEWARVYAVRRVAQTEYLRGRGETGVGLDVLDVANRRDPTAPQGWTKFEAERKLHDFLVALHAYGPTHEADLTPRQRLMTDRHVQVDDRYHELFFDIETDDSEPGWADKERWRHLAYAAVLRRRDGSLERRSWVIDREDDASERAMLRSFLEMVDAADILYAWNGRGFDFPILRACARRHRIDYDWRQMIWSDLLAVWKRYHSRSAVTSFALETLAPKVLGRPKLDWRTESEKRGGRVDRIVDLYRRHPDLLREYNENDAELLFELEERFAYGAADRIVGRLGNCFGGDPYVSTKVDALILNRGGALGHHYVTRGLQADVLPAYMKGLARAAPQRLGLDGEMEAEDRKSDDVGYAGAYVFPPVTGYHEGVAALDFKSLYPTLMVLFNISPETWVARDRRGEHDPANLITTPSGATFLRRCTCPGGDGVIPLVFRETTEQRKVYTRFQLAETVGSEAFKRYERIALAFKITGLAFYGSLGYRDSRFFNPEIAEAVTLTGQWFVKKTAELAERRGYRVSAGDTDSLYLEMTEAQARAFVAECDGYYRGIVRPFNVDPSRFLMELEFENYFASLVITTKKRYAGVMTRFKGKASDYLEVKGLECVRSDGLEYARAMQRRFLERILRGRRPAVAEIVTAVEAERAVVFSGRLGVDDVQMTQAVEKPLADYKTTPPHVVVARRIAAVSTEFHVGMKVPYVMVPGPIDQAKPKRKGAPAAVWAREYVEGTYDRAHAWAAKIYPPTLRVLEAAYPEVDWGALLAAPPGTRAAERTEPVMTAAALRALGGDPSYAERPASAIVRRATVRAD